MAPKRAWTTLITRPSYLAGVILLSHTLRKYFSSYPLIVLYTPSLPSECLSILRALPDHTTGHLLLQAVDPLIPSQKVSVVAERFEDTWTKLRVFEALLGYEQVVYLDADIMVMGPMDGLFDFELPGKDWLGANHACTCNIDHDPWAPPEWTVANCPYTPQRHPDALEHGVDITPSAPPTYHLMNSGVFLFHPSPALWSAMKHFLDTTPLLATFTFPDQNFLDEFFRHKWRAIGWQYNATKCMEYWHRNIWRDGEVKALHYIVDKPWERRIGKDGRAGYKGRDGKTHRWWWDEWGRWEGEMRRVGKGSVVERAGGYVARPLEEENGEDEKTVLMPKSLGEHGHGPVVHPEKVAAG
ncbi:MAG: hypothetical protein M1817_006383 [Caeruleum heppii]|nr:MAG: hypothetical protein M1817_006383 [Caeruleum heppii]